MTKQLRIYTAKEGKLDAWARLYREKVRPLREREGFSLEAYCVPATSQFVWIVELPGGKEAFETADKAYYALPEHLPLHEEALDYLASSQSLFLDPVDDAA